jgi:hypothetical protein
MKDEAEITAQFYDDMAPLYHLVYEDWDASIARQANMLESVFKERWTDAADSLDVSCGIGTQALGLAAKGYRITASDLAPGAIGGLEFRRRLLEQPHRLVQLSAGPPIGGFRPAATYLFQSLATACGANATAVVLYFADVPPCHWAFEAVSRLAGTLFVGFPPRDDYLAVNAVRQVFEGLRCEDPSWSLRFLEGAPQAFAVGVPVRLVGFELETALLSLEADRAEVSLALLASLEEAGERRIATRQGTVNIVRTADGWRADYADFAALELDLFPPPVNMLAPRPAQPQAIFLGASH